MSSDDSGATVMRQMLAARNKKFNLAPLARELNMSAGALEEFAYGRAGLTPEVLVALAKILFDGQAEYDPAIDKLRSKREEPRPLGVLPPPITEMMTLPVYKAGPAPPAPGMVTPSKPKARRAGWVE
jgi:hypothetical protein